jgi:signal peptidase I
MSKAKPNDAKKQADAKDKAADEAKDKPADGGWRETVESIAMAVILALLFRGFVAEAFVIPTGSMAPTLQGRHKDVECPQCHYWYQVSASHEREQGTDRLNGRHVVAGTCPICRYSQELDLFGEPNHGSFSGDRIIVGKFAYDLAEPKRWDVIVFKYPLGAVQNYIKRLIGLPNEWVRIAGGNILTCPVDQPESALRIARKPPHKLDAMLQVVDDTDYIAPALIEVLWPLRWQEWTAGGVKDEAWQEDNEGRSYVTSGTHGHDAWLRYRHLVPSHEDWRLIETSNQLPSGVQERRGQLITDFYAYNTGVLVGQRGGTPYASYLTPENSPAEYDPVNHRGPGEGPSMAELGQHWVDDLAVECTAEVTGNEGELLLDLVRAGVHHQCRINLADGVATLSRVAADGTAQEFMADDGTVAASVTAKTTVKGPGKYRLRLSNCDHEVLLWVNGSVVTFDGPTTYDSNDLVEPFWSPADPGDLAPAGVGSRGAAVRVSSLRVLRDKYYIAVMDDGAGNQDDINDYDKYVEIPGSPIRDEGEAIQAVFATPELWETTKLFSGRTRRYVEFKLHKDQFLPMGDNSPQSSDGRFWSEWTRDEYGNPVNVPHHYVERELLIGKALLIYWPHTWNRPIPFTPNVTKMGRIR